MKKKSFIFLLILLFSFGLVACQTTSATTTTTTTSSSTTTTTTTTSQTTQSTTAFVITLAGLGDAGYTDEDKIYTGEQFDLMAGVTAFATDGVDYAANASLVADDPACTITGNMLVSNSAKTCVVTYTVVVGTKYARADRNVKISAAPVVMEFTETDLFDNDAVFGTDYVVTVDDPGVNLFHYWAANASVLGTTGSIQVSGGKLIIAQEDMGGVNYGLQTIALTDVSLNKGQYYKITMTITSDTARVIDIVTKAPNNDYGNDTHSLIEIAAGTAEYEMVFKANQTKLHLNIMTGAVEGNMNAGTLEFSGFTLWEGPIVYDYEELADFFANADIAVGSDAEYITGTDTDYVREFYYWDQASGALMTGETVEGGIALTVVTQASDTWGIQLQWNDINKAGTPLIVGSHYKLVMNINSPVVRTINLAVTGKTNALASSGSKDIELAVGDNVVELEFASLYDYFFMKIMFGNYGDLVQTGTYTITGLELWQEVGFVPEDPEPEPEPVSTSFGIYNGDFDAEGFALNDGVSGWTTWTNAGEATFAVVDGAIEATIVAVGTEVWHAQLCYRPLHDDVVIGNTYSVEFDVHATVAGTFSMEMTTTGNAANVAIPVTLEVGDNHVVVEYVAYEENFMLTACIGTYGIGVLTFDNFVAYELIPGGIQNGNFEPSPLELNGDGSVWTTWTNANEATFAVVDEAIVATITAVGSEVWHAQLCYRPATDDVVVGSTYVVEFDVNATVAGTFSMEMTTTGNAGNVAFPVTLVVGDNHVTLQYVAYEANFKLTACIGMYGVAVLTFDNFSANLLDGAEIFSYDFSPTQVALNDGVSGWTTWTNAGEATFAMVNGKIEATIVAVGTEVWHAQLCYRPATDDVVVGDTYRVEFDVNATVAGTFSMEMTTTGNAANVAIPVTLEVGDNHVVVYYVAYEANFKLTACIGMYGVGVLVFDNFVMYHELAPYVFPEVLSAGIYNGTFDNNGFALNDGMSAWTTWTNAGEATFAVVDGAVEATIVAVGTEVWHAQLCYRPLTDDVIPGNTYIVEFDVNATVAGTFSMEMSTTGNAANIAIPVTLEVGDNHVVVEYVAYEANFMLTACIGTYGIAVLTFDNFYAYELQVDGLTNGNFDAEGFALNNGTSGWTTWTNGGEATFAVVGGAIEATIVAVGTEVWHAQLCYRPATDDVVVGDTYRIEFDVNATVAGTFNMEMTTTGNAANVAIPVTLVVGDNHVAVEYVAYEANFKLTACIGMYGIGVLVFDNFVIYHQLAPLVLEVTQDQFAGMVLPFNPTGDLQINPAADPINEFFLWAGYNFGWNGGWTAFAEVTGSFDSGSVSVDIINESAPEFWGIQLKYHGGSIDVGDSYILSFNVNAENARTINVEVHNASGQYVTQNYDLVVGDNAIELPFEAAYEFFNLQFNLGNFSEADESGLLVFSQFELSKVPVYAMNTIKNTNGDLLINPTTDPAQRFFLWAGYNFGWNGGWTAFAEVSGTFTDGAVSVDIVNESAPEFWGIQLKYHGGIIEVGTSYVLSFTVNAENARTINVEVHNASGQYVTQNYDLVAGDNTIELTFTAAYDLFNLQFNLGNFDAADESGLLVFSLFDLSVAPTE